MAGRNKKKQKRRKIQRYRLPVTLLGLRSCTVSSLATPSQQSANRVRHRLGNLTPPLRLRMFDIEQTDVGPIPDAQRGRTADVYLSPYQRS